MPVEQRQGGTAWKHGQPDGTLLAEGFPFDAAGWVDRAIADPGGPGICHRVATRRNSPATSRCRGCYIACIGTRLLREQIAQTGVNAPAADIPHGLNSKQV